MNEDFAVESMAGDIFLLGNRSWRIRRVEAGRVRVEDAAGAPPTIPFWLGEAPARTAELSAAVAELRVEVAARAAEPALASQWLMREAHVDAGGAEQIVHYIGGTLATLGAVPTPDTIIAERFFDEGGGMQLVLHAPFGGRVNRALGLALRKRFCVTFDFELQAAATDDGVVLSLGEQHSFPLDSVFGMVRSHSFLADLVQAALLAPMFGNRWRWNATRALALLRFNGGRRVPMPLQRMRAEDLLAAVFPAQLACGDNHGRPDRAARSPAGQGDHRQLPARGDGSRRPAHRARAHRVGRDPHAGGRHRRAVADVARDPQRQPVRVPRRCAAGRAPRPRRLAAPHRSRPRRGDRCARPRGDRGSAPPGVARCARRG